MKTKYFCNVIMVAFIVVIFSVLAGCPSTGATVDGEPSVAAAAQLAVDINAAKVGSAEAEGSTVRLTSGFDLTTGLIVPAGVTLFVSEGVTLDLTADSATLTIGNNAVLTVNGTVNALGHDVEGSLRVNGMATINGIGTVYLKSKGELFYIGKDKKLTLDGVTLVGLEDNNDSLVLVDEGGELVMKGGAITANTRIGEDWSGGGGVQVAKSGIFTMQGGTISDNTVKGKWNYGGGVYVEGAFTMNGGQISGNGANGGDIEGSGNGGGVYIGDAEGATFILAGGEISGNKITGKAGGGGAGVYINEAIFTMKDGVISGNSNTATYSDGGGVSVSENSTFIMEGGAIWGNSANGAKWGAGGGVNINGGMEDVSTSIFIMKGGRIQGGKDSDGLAKNTGPSEKSAAIWVWNATVQWGTGGTYTRGGVSQTGGSDILSSPAKVSTATDDTLIAEPAR
jgi:hypothetical protein